MNSSQESLRFPYKTLAKLVPELTRTQDQWRQVTSFWSVDTKTSVYALSFFPYEQRVKNGQSLIFLRVDDPIAQQRLNDISRVCMLPDEVFATIISTFTPEEMEQVEQRVMEKFGDKPDVPFQKKI